MAQHDRITALTGIDPWRVDVTKIDEVVISTVFLGLDYRMSRRGPPLLFETRVFGGSLDRFQNRCATWDKAEAMHAEAVALVRGEHVQKLRRPGASGARAARWTKRAGLEGALGYCVHENERTLDFCKPL